LLHSVEFSVATIIFRFCTFHVFFLSQYSLVEDLALLTNTNFISFDTITWNIAMAILLAYSTSG